MSRPVSRQNNLTNTKTCLSAVSGLLSTTRPSGLELNAMTVSQGFG
jgi:hypothetical protein